MLSRLSDLENTFALMNELRRRLVPEHAWEDFEPSWSRPKTSARVPNASTWPRINLFDSGGNLVLTADVPGLSDKDVQVTLHDDAITIHGERVVAEPAGYAAHRQERGNFKFARTVAMPCKVNPEQINACVKNGVLTITLAKAPEAQPRRISVRAQ